MRLIPRRPWVRVLAAAVILAVLVAAGFGLYLASLAGALPWQVEPTRIAITPFAGIPGFGAPTAAPTPTAVPASPASLRWSAGEAFEVPTPDSSAG